jgi:hypothetical protein
MSMNMDPMGMPLPDAPAPEPMGAPMGAPMPEALDPDMAIEMMVAGIDGVLSDYMKKKQALEGIAELSAMAVMGQGMETLDGPAGTEMLPDEELLAEEAALADEALGEGEY